MEVLMVAAVQKKQDSQETPISNVTLQMSPMQWANLEDIDEVERLNPGDYECLAEVREVLKKHGKRDKFGVALLHKHFDLAEGEVLMEKADPKERVLTIKPVKQKKAGTTTETIWKLVDGDNPTACQFCCSPPSMTDTRHHPH
jgi:hypothetical protein